MFPRWLTSDVRVREEHTQVEKTWQDEGSGELPIIALGRLPGGKKVASGSGSEDGAVRLWTEHTRGL